MTRLVGLSLILAACSVGEVPPGGNNAGPDAPGGTMTDAPIAAGGGSLTINANTAQTPNAVYAPNNVLAIWVEDSTGAFVKTLYRASATYTLRLVAWSAIAPAADVDGLSGASRTAMAPVTATWNMTNKAGAVVPDGTYTIRMELSDSNATQEGQNNQGEFTVIKGPSPQSQTALTSGGFTNVSLNYTPQ
jgi:hypothetical protein